MSKPAAPVLLRDLDDKNSKSRQFEADHAERLLAYPGSRFVKADENSEPAVPFVQRVRPARKKPAATEIAPAAASPAPDATTSTE